MSKCRYNLSEDCNDTDCLKCVLDRIKRDVFNACSDNYHMPVHKLDCDEIFDIIDKYKPESKGQGMITEKGLLEESYEIIKTLCDGMMDMPCGCDGCPLYDEDKEKCDKEIWEEQYKELRKGVQK